MQPQHLTRHVSLALVAGAVLAGVVLQATVPLNHDVAWIGHSASWLLDGREFGADIVDPSPPLAWYLSVPAAVISRAGLLDEIAAIRFLFWSLTCLSLLLCFRVLQPLSTRGRESERAVLVAATAVIASIMPGRDFGQRDVTAIVLGLPYLFLVAGQIEFGNRARMSDAIMAGLMAGIGFCLKPFLLLIPVLVELLRYLSARDWRIRLSPEAAGILAVGATYGATVLTYSSGYVTHDIPIIKAVYWAYDTTSYWLMGRLKESITPLVLGMGIVIATWRSTAYHWTIAVACLGAGLSYWAQGKGFTYHAFPVLALAWIFLAYAVLVGSVSLTRAVRPVLGSIVATLGLLGLGVLAFPALRTPVDRSLDWYRDHNMTTGVHGRALHNLIETLRGLGVGPGTYVYALTTHPGPAFPALNYLGTEWAGRSATQFVIPAFVRRAEIRDARKRGVIEELAEEQVREVTAALEYHQPRVVLVDNRPARLGLGARKFDFVAFYSRNPDFRRVWACYDDKLRLDGISVFLRGDECVVTTEPVGGISDTAGQRLTVRSSGRGANLRRPIRHVRTGLHED